MDIEELKRLHAEIWDSPCDPSEWDIAIHNAFPAIVARLEAAQRLRDALAELPELVPDPMEITKRINAALASFDKEQQ